MNSPVRTVLTAASIVLAVAACGKKESAEQAQQPGAGAQEEKVLHVFNWSDYIAEDTVRHQGHLRRLRFERRAGDPPARR
jgi:spermidine/putrescine-binding protein